MSRLFNRSNVSNTISTEFFTCQNCCDCFLWRFIKFEHGFHQASGWCWREPWLQNAYCLLNYVNDKIKYSSTSNILELSMHCFTPIWRYAIVKHNFKHPAYAFHGLHVFYPTIEPPPLSPNMGSSHPGWF